MFSKQELIVEPEITMAKLTNIQIPKGWTIPAVPKIEMLNLNVGGLICGAGIETSSHKCGPFADIEYEIVFPTAEAEKVVEAIKYLEVE